MYFFQLGPKGIPYASGHGMDLNIYGYDSSYKITHILNNKTVYHGKQAISSVDHVIMISMFVQNNLFVPLWTFI